ncbi:hypothetical protein OSTOST_10945, partial [Ostertagia ostertagi]
LYRRYPEQQRKFYQKLLEATDEFSEVLDDKVVLQQLKDENFDVAITELFDFIGIGVLEAIGLKNIVGAHSAIMMEGTSLALGVPLRPSFIPAFFGVTSDSTDFWTRATNLLFTCLSWYFQTSTANAADRVMKAKLGPNATPVWEWDRILKLREHTVLISFGSIAKSKFMPESMKRAIINLPEHHLHLEVRRTRRRNLQWNRQSYSFKMDATKLFISRQAFNTFYHTWWSWKYDGERPPRKTAYCRSFVWRSEQEMRSSLRSILLEKGRLTDSNVLREAIEQILTDFKYQTAANRISRLLSRRPFSPEEKLVKTVELAAEFGDLPELKVSGRNLGYVAYYNLDLLFILAMIFAALLSPVIWYM